MDRDLLNRLMNIAVGGLLVVGVVFLGIRLFQETEDNTYLCIGLACVTLGNLLNIVRNQIKQK